MRRVRTAAAAWLVPLAASLATPATARTDDLVARAAALVRDGHAAEAYALLQGDVDARTDDADFDYTLGLAAIDSGHPAEGILALQRTLALQPDNAQARAEIARAYAAVGDIDTARREFASVSGDPTIPDPVRQRFGALVRGFDKVNRPGFGVSGYGEVGGGYDSNVNAATSQSQIVIPLLSFLGPASLSGSAQRQGDGFASAEGGLSVDYGFDRQSRVFLSALASSHTNFRQHDFNQIFTVGTLGFSHAAADHDVVSVSGQLQRFWLGGTDYRHAIGAIGQYTHVTGGHRALSLSGQFFDIRLPTDRARDARRYTGSLSFTDGAFYASAQGGYEDAKRPASAEYSNAFFGGRLAFEHAVGPGLSLFANAEIEHRSYSAPDTLFLIERRDTQIDASAGARFRVLKPLTLIPRVSFTHNASNIALDRYDRVTGMLSLRAEF